MTSETIQFPMGAAQPNDIFNWLQAHSRPIDKEGMLDRVLGEENFRVLTHPVRAWKKTLMANWPAQNQVIVELLLPAGAIVYTEWGAVRDESTLKNLYRGDRKMRADHAVVVRQIDSHRFMYAEDLPPLENWGVTVSRSSFDRAFLYRNGETVRPGMVGGRDFSYMHDQCMEGIHFFLRIGDALRYTF